MVQHLVNEHIEYLEQLKLGVDIEEFYMSSLITRSNRLLLTIVKIDHRSIGSARGKKMRIRPN